MPNFEFKKESIYRNRKGGNAPKLQYFEQKYKVCPNGRRILVKQQSPTPSRSRPSRPSIPSRLNKKYTF